MRLGDCLADYAVSSYTPSLDALLTLQDAPQTWRTSDLRSCVLAEPHPTAYLHMSPLPAVGKEAAIVADQLLRAEVQDATLTRSAAEALAALKTAHLFHFAGHGQWSRGDVLGSEFILRGRNLSVSEVIDAFPTNPVLAYLSQCSSTSGPTLGPAAAMLFCGFKSIVSTMWYGHE
jgi:CHAT domain-containing protein